MKYFDKVKFIGNEKKYLKYDVKTNEIGRIIQPEIRNSSFLVVFIDPNFIEDDRFAAIKIEDLELIEESKITDEQILLNLPKQDPHWWCKVENGYILELGDNAALSSSPNIFKPQVSSSNDITADIYTDSYMWLVYSARRKEK